MALWSRRFEVALAAIVILGLSLWGACGRIAALTASLEARPKTEAKSETVKRIGPKRTETKTTIKPDGERVIERVEVIDSQETSTATESKSEPVKVRQPRWIVGASTSPLDHRAVMVRAGVTIAGRVDVTLGYALYGPAAARTRIDVAFRF